MCVNVMQLGDTALRRSGMCSSMHVVSLSLLREQRSALHLLKLPTASSRLCLYVCVL